MMLKSLHIRRVEAWETPKTLPGQLTGTLETTDPTGEVKINLDDAACRMMLEYAAQGIRAAASATANFLATEAQVPLLVDES